MRSLIQGEATIPWASAEGSIRCASAQFKSRGGSWPIEKKPRNGRTGLLPQLGSTTSYRLLERIARNGGPQISPSALTFVLSFLVALSLVMAANIWIYSMWKEVNPRLPKDAQIDIWDRSKLFEILRLHAEMYPASPKRWQMWTLFLSGAIFGFGGFIASGFMPH